MQDIRVDFITNSIIITKSFADAASIPDSEECTRLQLIKKDNPTMKIVLRSTKAAGHKSACKGLTYKYMRKFISVMDKDNLINFEKALLYYEGFGYDNGTVYQYVKAWFLENYPYHKEMIVDAAPKIAA
ncbi:MAG: hypothetical protein LUI12_07215 [Clostridiales bacterium]|nr:hypothetical protein [Clostridiales bacterium]